MKLIAITAVALGLAAASTAFASDRVTDVDYLKASRCKGLAEGLGQTDLTAVTAFLKANGRVRESYIIERGETEVSKAKREARGDRKERAVAEVAGPCSAFLGGGSDMAAAGKAVTTN
jgi:hypothetical protein